MMNLPQILCLPETELPTVRRVKTSVMTVWRGKWRCGFLWICFLASRVNGTDVTKKLI